MRVEVKVHLNPAKLVRLQSIVQQAFCMTVDAVLSDIQISGTVPKDTGELERSGFSEIETKEMVARIVFDTPYARRLYWHPEYDFRKDKNPDAQGLWMQTYIDGEKKDFVKNTFSAFLRQLGGGIIK